MDYKQIRKEIEQMSTENQKELLKVYQEKEKVNLKSIRNFTTILLSLVLIFVLFQGAPKDKELEVSILSLSIKIDRRYFMEFIPLIISYFLLQVSTRFSTSLKNSFIIKTIWLIVLGEKNQIYVIDYLYRINLGLNRAYIPKKKSFLHRLLIGFPVFTYALLFISFYCAIIYIIFRGLEDYFLYSEKVLSLDFGIVCFITFINLALAPTTLINSWIDYTKWILYKKSKSMSFEEIDKN